MGEKKYKQVKTTIRSTKRRRERKLRAKANGVKQKKKVTGSKTQTRFEWEGEGEVIFFDCFCVVTPLSTVCRLYWRKRKKKRANTEGQKRESKTRPWSRVQRCVYVYVCRRRKAPELAAPLIHRSSAHSFSFLIWASSSGVKSLTMLKALRISSGVLPLMMLATVLQPTSRRGLISR